MTLTETQRHLFGWFIIGIIGMMGLLAAGYWGSYQTCKAGEGKLVGGPIAYACVGYKICDPYTVPYGMVLPELNNTIPIPEFNIE